MTWYIHRPTKQDWHGDPSEVPWPLVECLSWPKLEKPSPAVLAVPPHYRIIDGDNVRVATAAERAAIDAAMAADRVAAAAAARNAALDAAAGLCATIETSADPLALLLLGIVEELVEEFRGLKGGNPKASRELPQLAADCAARLRGKKT